MRHQSKSDISLIDLLGVLRVKKITSKERGKMKWIAQFIQSLGENSSKIRIWFKSLILGGLFTSFFVYVYVHFNARLVCLYILNANRRDHDRPPHSAASDLGLHYFRMSLLWVARHKWLNWFYMHHFRGSPQQQFMTKSIVVGRSRGNFEEEDYPDAPDR